ncbi:hypothetical protein [Pseudomonas baetica]|uniref:hypothetical protein n=1 Tax=Pseudomonas baetica TaxID=674054 RepID=UPI0024067B19|nr:hypothetical protein [Pseudomonas baetica]MDF9778823.1 hypothetical protein [Pseudomonas baetica]
MAEQDVIAAAAARILQLPRQHTDSAQRFRFTPSIGVVEELQENTRPPFATVTGGANELKALLRSFEGWDGELKIGVLLDQGLLDFWLY